MKVAPFFKRNYVPIAIILIGIAMLAFILTANTEGVKAPNWDTGPNYKTGK